MLCHSKHCDSEVVSNKLEGVALENGPKYVLVKRWAMQGLTYAEYERRGGRAGEHLTLGPALMPEGSSSDAAALGDA